MDILGSLYLRRRVDLVALPLLSLFTSGSNDFKVILTTFLRPVCPLYLLELRRQKDKQVEDGSG